MAITTIAGARLRNVVIQIHTIGRDLLQHKALRGHESFMPLNKITYKIAKKEVCQKLESLSKGRVRLALDLLEYDERYKEAIAHVFGNVFVADDTETAKLVAMDSNMEKFNCVTLQGDSYRVDGILSGGAN